METQSQSYMVYIISMTTYCDHDYKELQPKNVLNICNVVSVFPDFNSAEKWLFKHGKKLNDNFYELYEQGCAFNIVEHKNYTTDDNFEDFLNNSGIDMYMTNRQFPTYVFSSSSYNMVLNEHFIFVSHDWSESIPWWITYIAEDGNVLKGCTDDHFKKCLAFYRDEYKEAEIQKFEKLKDNHYTGNNKESQKCVLILTEGDSATTFAVSKLATLSEDHKYYGNIWPKLLK